MKVVSKNEFLANKDFYSDEILKGKIFVYPTDTIYGIGCDAKNSKSIEKIRLIKKRDEKSFSIIVPSKDWIFENCFVGDEKELEKLPGKFTFILKLKNFDCVAKGSLVKDLEGIGVRIPDNWFAEFLSKKNLVFVTTSVNVSGEPHLLKMEDLKSEIEKEVDYFIEEGVLDGSPSKIINLVSGEVVRI